MKIFKQIKVEKDLHIVHPLSSLSKVLVSSSYTSASIQLNSFIPRLFWGKKISTFPYNFLT